jgi:ABC-2 type transport system permease protein
MKNWRFELLLLLRSRPAAAALVLLALLASLAVWSGMRTVDSQREALQRIASVHAADIAQRAARQPADGDAGLTAYYTPHLTFDPPAALAFAAVGQRDVQPFALQVRALGLQAQLYESEAFNPELAAPGRFDFAFVLVYLAPLFIIALMHDLVSGEREAGRLRLLASLPGEAGTMWRRRVLLRLVLVAAALMLPLLAGAALSGAALGETALLALACLLYLGFWCGLAAWGAAVVRSAAAGAAVLLAAFVLLALVLPTAVNAALERALPVAQGAELALAQRQAVHTAWDTPREETMRRFFRTHPEWQATPPLPEGFHWKWYYAMHQAGDDLVAEQAAQYRAALWSREAWTRHAGLVLAGVNAQVLLHRLAGTDLEARLAYLDRVGAFHAQVRRTFYPYVFHERPFGPADFARLPEYVPAKAAGTPPASLLAALTALAGAALLLGLRRTARVIP